MLRGHRSPLVRGRGSKRLASSLRRTWYRRPSCGGADRNLPNRRASSPYWVAPRAGARIETTAPRHLVRSTRSPLVRGRGSKRLLIGDPIATPSSPLVRGRGSKHFPVKRIDPQVNCRPSCGGADRNHAARYGTASSTGRPSCGGADRNKFTKRSWRLQRRSPLVRGRGSKQPSPPETAA